MSQTATAAVVDLDDLPPYPTPRDPREPFLPSPELRRLHEEGIAITRVRTFDGAPWLIASHALQREIMPDKRLSADDRIPGFPHLVESSVERPMDRPPTIAIADGEPHARLRRMLTNSFTRNRMEAIRPKIQKLADKLIDDMLAGPNPADLMEAFSLPLPSLMICDLLGVSYSEHDYFQSYATIINAREKTAEQAEHAMTQIAEYMGEHIKAKMKNPGEDVLTDLAKKVQSGDLGFEEASRLGRILVVAGHDTSANMITLGTAALLQHPDQAAILRDTDNPRVVLMAVEELLRYLTIPHMMQRRVAVEDIELGGQIIRAGDGVISSVAASNFDPAAFPDPEKLDLTRDARHHLTFGWGPHQCIGQQLARVELQVVFPTLLRRIPTLRLAADFDSLRFKQDSLAYGIYELPVAW